jgi:DNA-binding NarL/FixJ family response regulator
MNSYDEQIAAGRAALDRGLWSQARSAFQAALAEQDTAEAHDGLGLALWWLNRIPEAHEHRTIAFNGFKNEGELRSAALIAAWLAREQVFLDANVSAMKGWFARAERLVAEAGECAERGWVTLFRSSMLDDPAALEVHAAEAVAIARTHGDVDLEIISLAFAGLARVTLGRVEEGMACLDEAMAAATGGEVRSMHAVSEIFCVLLSACAVACDLPRTEQWCRVAEEYARRNACSFLSAYCRTAYGGFLTAIGRWSEAEQELTGAITAFEQGHRALRVHATLKLAELRISQGRIEDAALLLARYEDHGAAMVPRARYHLARHEPELARALLAEALARPTSPTSIRRIPLLLLQAEACTELGDSVSAASAAEAALELARLAGSDLLIAQAELALGNAGWSAGSSTAAGHYRAALEHLRSYEGSLVAARARLATAIALKGSDRAGAITWCRAALTSFERIGAAPETDRAASLLRELGAGGRSTPRSPLPLTHREEEVLSHLAHGLTNREIAERLVISAKTVEHHVGRILGKLGLRSRTEAAAYAARRNA